MTSDDQGSSPDYALTYNDNDRLASLTAGGSALASYTYDATEHRVIKTVSGGSGYTHHFMYDRDGQLIAESDNTGTVIREYIWLGGLPIGLVDSTSTPTLYFVHADHLATPQKATNSSKTIVWDAQVQPFGEIASVTGALTQLLQFPGQYHDAETGFNDNWHRTYDPSTGRYLQSDPLGIGAGPNVYAYGAGNPISNTDPDGQCIGPLAAYCAEMIVGAVVGAAIDVGLQLAENGGRFECVNGGEVAVSAALGALGPLGRFGKFGQFLADESGAVGASASKGLGGNPFRGKSPQDIANMFTKKGYVPKGPDPVSVRGTYVNPTSGRAYHIDANHLPPKGPHVGVGRPRNVRDLMPGRDYPL